MDHAATDLAAVGLGLDYHELELHHVTDAWVDAGARLRDHTASVLDGEAAGVEHIGSTAVTGLLAKPIVDLAVGALLGRGLTAITDRLAAEGWIHRGDAGDQGGQVFVLEARPWFRVAHIHVVEHGASQWRDYLLLRDVLRTSPHARARYGQVKQHLAAVNADDRAAYTAGKTEVVQTLLSAGGS